MFSAEPTEAVPIVPQTAAQVTLQGWDELFF